MKNGIQAKITAKNESALDRFVSKINAYSNTSMKGFAEFLADKAEEYLLGLYAGADDITVSVQMSDGGNTATILVNGDQVSEARQEGTTANCHNSLFFFGRTARKLLSTVGHITMLTNLELPKRTGQVFNRKGKYGRRLNGCVKISFRLQGNTLV